MQKLQNRFARNGYRAVRHHSGVDIAMLTQGRRREAAKELPGALNLADSYREKFPGLLRNHQSQSILLRNQQRADLIKDAFPFDDRVVGPEGLGRFGRRNGCLRKRGIPIQTGADNIMRAQGIEYRNFGSTVYPFSPDTVTSTNVLTDHCVTFLAGGLRHCSTTETLFPIGSSEYRHSVKNMALWRMSLTVTEDILGRQQDEQGRMGRKLDA